jgi:hypothetical protein
LTQLPANDSLPLATSACPTNDLCPLAFAFSMSAFQLLPEQVSAFQYFSFSAFARAGFSISVCALNYQLPNHQLT